VQVIAILIKVGGKALLHKEVKDRNFHDLNGLLHNLT
jgi:hypothetical protein